MKATFTVLLISLALHGVSQPDKYATALMTTPVIAIDQHQVSFKDGTQPALTAFIAAQESEYEKNFKSWLKSNYMIEAKKASGFYSAYGVVIGAWSPDTMNLHFKTDRDGDGTKLFLLLEQKGTFISEQTHPEIFSKEKNAIAQQLKDFYIRYYDSQITDQQKHYDNQVGDLDKLRKKQERLNGELNENGADVLQANANIRSADIAISQSDTKIKMLGQEKENNKKGVDQAKKEVDAQALLIRTKETEYNRLNVAGALNTKDGQQVMNDLEKLKSKQEKLQGTLTKANATLTKSENSVLKEEKNKTSLETRLNDARSALDKLNSKSDSLKSDITQNEQLMKSEQAQLETARLDLDRLKTAKSGLMAQ